MCRNFRKAWLNPSRRLCILGQSRGDSPSSPQHPVSGLQAAFVLPAHRVPTFFSQGFALGLLQATLRFESPNCTAIFQKTSEEIRKTLFFLFLLNKKRVSVFYTEQGGFEPPVPCGTTVFKTASFNHSDTAPKMSTYLNTNFGRLSSIGILTEFRRGVKLDCLWP
jgi:hypothetical protein